MDIGDLTPLLDVETNFTLEDPKLQAYLIAACTTFNAIVIGSPVVLSGTTYSRELTPNEQRLMVLLSMSSWLRGKQIEAATTSLVHSNVAGRTDLTQVAKDLRVARADLVDELKALTEVLNGNAAVMEAYCDELGETKGFNTWSNTWMRPYPYGYGFVP